MNQAVKQNATKAVSLHHSYTRIGAGIIPAALITAGLYFGMQAMIHVDSYEHPPKTVRILNAYVAGPEIDPSERPKRDRIPQPTEIMTPPPIEKYKATIVPVNIQAVSIGAAPVELHKVSRTKLDIAPVILVDDEDVRPISAPVVVYPVKAAQRNLEGKCDVRMDVSARGEPYNIRPICSHSVFESEAKRSMSGVRFRPKIQRGVAMERRNVVYPLEFKLS